MQTSSRHPALLLLTLLLAAGCEDMYDQPRYDPGETSDFFADGQAERQQVKGTLAQGQLIRNNSHLYAGKIDGKEAETFPFTITKADLERGRERYNIYCSVCHGATGGEADPKSPKFGQGNGMIVQRGFVPPPSLHLDRLKTASPGHLFGVITNGWGAMYSYDDRIDLQDRWRIAAYVKVLQFSQGTELASLPPEDQEKVRNANLKPTAEDKKHGGTGHE